MYVVIEFREISDAGDNSEAIVRKSWLSPRKQDVFWPPIRNQKVFDKTLQSETHEDIEKWKLYPVARCLYETDDLEKAKQKLKLAEVTYDLLTDDESAKQIHNKKRKVVTPRRYITSDDEESDNNNRPP
ncbi:hypothetical protein JTB14_012908 [Gonioctena quinquepunctata]|nr:hypothetical protein JTB14_012908 [Gonioctena quinquepunctata]